MLKQNMSERRDSIVAFDKKKTQAFIIIFSLSTFPLRAVSSFSSSVNRNMN